MTFASDDEYSARQVLAQFDAPAYVRRALSVETEWQAVLDRCQWERNELLPMVKMRLARLRAMAGEWDRVRPLLEDPQDAARLAALFEEWQPRLRIAVLRVPSLRQLIGPLRELAESCLRFNRRFEKFIAEMSLDRVNELRDGYNRYYVLEKECATRSPLLARRGFRPLPPASHAELRERFPLLPECSLRS